MVTDAQRRIAEAVFKAIEDDPDVVLMNHEPVPFTQTYGELLDNVVQKLFAVNGDIHEYMAVPLNGNADNDEWQELYTFTRAIAALADTARIYQRHTYPPF